MRYTSIYLTVNKQNTVPIKVYQKFGFIIKEAIIIDIGNGFVMDDYIIEKKLDYELDII